MKLKGEAAEEFMEQTHERARQRKAEMLAAAKADAACRGKEPFDLEKLEKLCDTSHEGRMAPYEERYAELERKYYVHFSEIMTISEFAREIDELNKW
jgi:hypothetical protein